MEIKGLPMPVGSTSKDLLGRTAGWGVWRIVGSLMLLASKRQAREQPGAWTASNPCGTGSEDKWKPGPSPRVEL